MVIGDMGDPIHNSADLVMGWLMTEPYNALLISFGLLMLALGLLFLIEKEEQKEPP